ncbi:MAG TPA: tetratricopeptide repeat protein [Gemmatimonadota bacterium]|nr:tetratricopeptide repeat protein [Gemmatimonadota bacterium]
MKRDSTKPPDKPIELRTLGQVSLRRTDGRELEDALHQSKRIALLTYLLAADPRGLHRRDSILALFWPELSEDRARNALNKAVHFLRAGLGQAAVKGRGTLEIGIEDGWVWCDAVAFGEALDRGRPEDAVPLYRGPFLEGLHVSDAPELEHWIDRQREHLELACARALEELAGRAASRNDPEGAAAWWRRLVEHDPLHTRAVIGLMECLDATGDRAAALQQAEHHAAVLREELDAEPDPDVEAVARRLRSTPRAGSGSRPRSGIARNLPWQPTPLLGREWELTEVRSLIDDPAVRLVTLSGPGGTGKTRLAVQVAVNAADRYTDGVFFIGMGTLTDPALVGVTIAGAVGVPLEAGSDIAESLSRGLDGRRCLLVLDGFEPVLPAGELISRLLEGTSGVEVLVTSRVVLQLRGEHVFPVPPLEVPRSATAAPPSGLEEFGSVALFLERARAADPRFKLTNENRGAVVGICAGLDGLPLAIELAAARVRILEPSMILARLSDAFELVHGPRDLPDRHQTLRRTFDWSYDLLPEPQQRLFRQLCVFAGGASLEAIRLVCRSASEDEVIVLDELAALADHSLLRQVPTGAGEPRFEMLDTIRECGRRVLIDTGELGELQRRHAEYFLGLAERAEPGLAGKGQTAWLDRLESELQNLRAALDWALESGEIELAVRLGSALWSFWWLRGHFTEMRWKLDQALARRDLLTPSLQANLLVARGAVASLDGEPGRAMTLFQEAFEVERESIGKRQVTQVLRSMAFGLSRQGEYQRARDLMQESLSLSRDLESPSEIAASLRGVAKMNFHLRDHERAEELYKEARELGQRHDDRQAVAWALHGLSEIARHRGDLDRAASLLEEGLEICRELDSKPGIAYLLLASAHAARYQGELITARAAYREALALLADLGNRRRIVICLLGIAALDVREGRFDRVAILSGAIELLSEGAGIRLAPVDESEYEKAEAALRSHFDAAELERLRRKGRGMGLEDVIEFALSD